MALTEEYTKGLAVFARLRGDDEAHLRDAGKAPHSNDDATIQEAFDGGRLVLRHYALHPAGNDVTQGPNSDYLAIVERDQEVAFLIADPEGWTAGRYVPLGQRPEDEQLAAKRFFTAYGL
jgi:hypothetical protein